MPTCQTCPSTSGPFLPGPSASGGDLVEVQSHTDTNKAKTSRPALSQQQAETVKLNLVAGGVSAGRIATWVLGATDPLVTSGQAEPQDRFVQLFPRFHESDREREEDADWLSSRIRVSNHCLTPSRLANAGAAVCNAGLTASQVGHRRDRRAKNRRRFLPGCKCALPTGGKRCAVPPCSVNVPAASAAVQRQRPAPHSIPAGPAKRPA